jgi:signal transduction histidine kinase
MKKNILPVPLYVVILFVICLVTLAGSGITNYQNLQKLKQNNDWMEHSWSVTDHLKNVNMLFMDAEASLRGYYLTGNPAYLGPWNNAKETLGAEFGALATLVRDNPAQKKNLAQLKLLAERKLARFEDNNRQFDQQGLSQLINKVKGGEDKEVMDEIRLLDVIMEKEEGELLRARRDLFYENYNHSLWIGNGINAVAMLVLILFFRLIQTGFKKQREIENTLQATNDNLETTVLVRTEQLAVLSRHLLKISEVEKARLARELHDELGANLTSISMELAMAMEKLKATDPLMAAQLARAKEGLREAVNIKRRIIENLRPSLLDNLGLAASIQNHYEETTRLAGLELDLEIAEDFDDIDPDLSIALFRIAQESLTNVVKYAQASRVKVSLSCRASRLWLRIADDGIGLPKDALRKSKTHGLLGMRERALLAGGSLTAGPGVAGRGTVIEVSIPLVRPETATLSETASA